MLQRNKIDQRLLCYVRQLDLIELDPQHRWCCFGRVDYLFELSDGHIENTFSIARNTNDEAKRLFGFYRYTLVLKLEQKPFDLTPYIDYSLYE